MGSFFENMGMMIRAGISTGEAVDLLKDESEGSKGKMTQVYTLMSEEMMMGSSLGDAMEKTGEFPSYGIDMTKASEYTGRLEATMFHLSDYYRTENKMKNTFVSAVRYPIILLVMVIAVLAAMLLMVFPIFDGVYENLFCKVLMVVMIVIVAVLLIGVMMYRSGKSASVRKAMSKIKTFDKLFENLDLYRFTACFDMFVAGGEMQDEAVKKSIGIVEDPRLKSKLESCCEKMSQGLSFSQAAFEESLYDPINNRMLIPAERSGMLDQIMGKILDSLRETNDKYISRIANTVEPLLTGFLMITIGLMLISLMIPLIGIMNSIG